MGLRLKKSTVESAEKTIICLIPKNSRLTDRFSMIWLCDLLCCIAIAVMVHPLTPQDAVCCFMTGTGLKSKKRLKEDFLKRKDENL